MLTIHIVIINFVLFSISAFLGIVEYDLEPTVTVVGRPKSSRTRKTGFKTDLMSAILHNCTKTDWKKIPKIRIYKSMRN